MIGIEIGVKEWLAWAKKHDARPVHTFLPVKVPYDPEHPYCRARSFSECMTRKEKK